MFLLFTLLSIWLLFGILTALWQPRWQCQRRSFIVAGTVMSSCAIFFFGISTACYIDDNAKDIASYRQIDNLITQREEIMNKNLPEIRKILVEQYPQHEKDIFQLITAHDIQWLWTRYPEMRAAETMQNYVNQLNAYTQWWQEQRQKQLELIAKTESRKNTPWAIKSIVPTINHKVVLESE